MKALLLFISFVYSTVGMAQNILDSLENELIKSSGENRIELLNTIGMKLIFKDQEKALNYSKSAISESQNLNYNTGEVTAIYIRGIVNDIRGVYDSSKYYFTLGYELSHKYGLNKLEGNGLNNLGMMNWNLGQFNEALDYFLKALRIYESISLEKGISKAISNIGLIYQELKQFEKALEYNFKSLKIRLEANNDDHIAKSYNNIGICFKSLNQFDSAIFYYKLGLDYAHKASSLQTEASITNNLANIYDLLNNHEKAINFHMKALKLNADRDSFSLISSYNNLGSLYNEVGAHNKALYYLYKSDSIIKKTGTKGHSLDMLRNKAEAYLRLNFPDSAKIYYDLWGMQMDSVFGEKSSKAVADMQTKYETEKKEKAIELLTAQTDLQNLQLKNNQYMFGGIGTVSILLIISTIALYSRKNHKLKANFAREKETQQKMRFKSVIEGEEKERKRIAQDLHDGLGQLLSTARLNVSVLEDDFDIKNSTSLNNSLKLIDDAVCEVRNISHNMMPNALISIGFEAALKEQVHLINDAGKVKIHLSLPEETIDLGESKAISLYRIIQEILNNALKYAEADNVWVNINHNNQLELSISIKDDGKGFDTKLVESSTGIGWRNILSRTDLLNGTLDIQSTIGKGSQVLLKLAV